LLVDYQEESRFEDFTGVYLCNVINSSNDKEFVLNLKNLDKTINKLGMFNTKNIAIYGNAGHNLGALMIKGNLVLNGDARSYVGNRMIGGNINVYGNVGTQTGEEMKNGLITINGDCTSNVGYNMEGGKIIVNGNAGYSPGIEMKSGVIELNGDYTKLSDHINGGDIWHRGIQIVKDGRTIPGVEIR
jgi:formylmethanofuran dehydrogenase subunit C